MTSSKLNRSAVKKMALFFGFLGSFGLFDLSLMFLSHPGLADNRGTQNTLELKSPETQTHLLELFSSEGCSSCPPADSWLASLRTRPGLWTQFVPIEFHVDYWNRLGWTDRLSKSAFTERQQTYSAEWSTSSVYTPGFVLNGNEWRPSWDTGHALEKPNTAPRVGILSAKRTGKLSYSVTFDSTHPLSQLRIFGALLGNGLESKVSAGENSGSVLKHEFAVISLTQNKMTTEKGHSTAIVQFTPPSTEAAKSYSVAFWVTSQDSQKPIQAVGGDLN